MGDLHVSVDWQGRVIEDRVLEVRGAVQLGDAPGAVVHFPGASLVVERRGERLIVRGRALAEGEHTVLTLGAVRIHIAHQPRIRALPRSEPSFDLRFGLVALAVVVGSLWVDALHAELATAQPGASPPQEAVLRGGAEPGAGQTAPLPEGGAAAAAPAQQGEGREALPDDHATGWAYYAWYRQAVPSTLDARIARLQLDEGAWEPELRGLAARGAYDSDDWRGALALYAALVSEHPHDLRWLVGQGLAQKRLGLHRAELATWDRVLELEPRDLAARANRAVALARLGDYDGAALALEALEALGSDAPSPWVAEGLILAIQGREPEAVAALEQAFRARGRLPAAQELELRRDLALDPALRPLRAGRDLRAMLFRQLGAAAPRPQR